MLKLQPKTRPAAQITGWAVDPKVPGPDIPPSGQSLFDRVVPEPVPFPFAALVAQIQSRLGPAVPLRRVLIPLGRSLQRSAAAPLFFEFPRAVAAFGDRLFLGYQEKAGILEVLSYNEDAGRFEFQLIHDYREGVDSVRVHAPRSVCTRCHQNHAPIFPRQLWDETNANAGIRELLSEQNRDFYGFPLEESTDVPYQIDQAVHRANLYSVAQRVWRSAASEPLRNAWLAAAKEYRATRSFDRNSAYYREHFAGPLIAGWQHDWRVGLWVPNPEIEDRSPLAALSRDPAKTSPQKIEFLVSYQRNIAPEFEPAVPRAPLEIWRSTDEQLPEKLVVALAESLPARLPEAGR